jgi:hypothetical protein
MMLLSVLQIDHRSIAKRVQRQLLIDWTVFAGLERQCVLHSRSQTNAQSIDRCKPATAQRPGA